MSKLLQSILWLVVAMLLGLGTAAATESRTLFQFGGLDYSEADLSAEQREKIFSAYAAYRQAIDGIVTDAAIDLYITEQANNSNRTEDAVRSELLPNTPVSQAQIQQFYEQNRARIPAPIEQVAGQIQQYLQTQRETAQKQALATRLRTQGQLKDMLPMPSSPKVSIATAGYPSKGPADAPITVVEFADFQCPHCQRAGPVVESMVGKFPGKVRVVFMHLPINRSGISRKVALGSVCAQAQDKFWAYHDLAFHLQSSLNNNSPMELAKTLNLDLSAFETCYSSEQAESQVARSHREAERLGVTGTPTIYVNGQRVRVVRELSVDLADAIQRAL